MAQAEIKVRYILQYLSFNRHLISRIMDLTLASGLLQACPDLFRFAGNVVEKLGYEV